MIASIMLAFDNESMYNSGVKKSATSVYWPAVLTDNPQLVASKLGGFFLAILKRMLYNNVDATR